MIKLLRRGDAPLTLCQVKRGIKAMVIFIRRERFRALEALRLDTFSTADSLCGRPQRSDTSGDRVHAKKNLHFRF